MQVTGAKNQDRKAFSLYEQALALRREALSEESSEHMKRQLALSYDAIASWYLNSGIPESARESARLYEEEIALLKEFTANDKTASLYVFLAKALHDAGELHSYMWTAGELERAAALCEEAVAFQTQVVRMRGMPAEKIARAGYQVTLADIYIRQGDAEYLDRTEKLLQEAIDVLEEPDHLNDVKEKFLLSAYAYRLYGDLLLKKNGESDREAAKMWYRRSAKASVVPEKTAYSCAELTELIGYFEGDLRAMLPVKLVMFFHKAALATYRKHVDPSIPVDEQELSQDTEVFLTILYSRYMADDEELAEVSEIVAENDAKLASS